MRKSEKLNKKNGIRAQNGKQKGFDSDSEEQDLELDRKLEVELQMLAEDPDLISDLKRLKRETKTVGIDA